MFYKHFRLMWTFFVNLAVFISMKAAEIAFMYECFVLNVTRPDPIGYLCLSVSIPEIKF